VQKAPKTPSYHIVPSSATPGAFSAEYLWQGALTMVALKPDKQISAAPLPAITDRPHGKLPLNN
jgi:hypothetical protein